MSYLLNQKRSPRKCDVYPYVLTYILLLVRHQILYQLLLGKTSLSFTLTPFLGSVILSSFTQIQDAIYNMFLVNAVPLLF